MSHGFASKRTSTRETLPGVSYADRFPSQSGVYSGFVQREEVATPNTLDDDDDQVTSVQLLKSREFARQLMVPPQPARQAKRPVWQVAMTLHGDELTRLWTQNAEAMSGRIFIWSEYTRAWVSLQTLPEFRSVGTRTGVPTIRQQGLRSYPATRAPISDSIAPVTSHRLTTFAQPVDLTNDARWLTSSLSRPQARWVVASIMLALGALVIGLPRMLAGSDKPATNSETAAINESQSSSDLQPASNADVKPALKVPQAQARQRTSRGLLAQADSAEIPEIVPVESLPLISASEPSGPRNYGAARDTKPQAATTNGSGHTSKVSRVVTGVRPFDPNLARQALAGAVWQTRRCASGEMSGTVLVTFDPAGSVKDMSVNTLAGDVSQTGCLISAMRTAKVAPFSGGPVVVRKSFRINH